MVLFEGVELFCAVILLAIGTAAHSFSDVWEVGEGGGWSGGGRQETRDALKAKEGDVVEGCVWGNAFDEARC